MSSECTSRWSCSPMDRLATRHQPPSKTSHRQWASATTTPATRSPTERIVRSEPGVRLRSFPAQHNGFPRLARRWRGLNLRGMTTETSHPEKLRVIIAGGGVAALETALVLADLAPEQTDVTVIAPNPEFVYRPMTVREPFAYGRARRYPLAEIVSDAGAELLEEELGWVDPGERTLPTETGKAIRYDALVLALGAHAHARYEHAVTIDDRQMDEALHGLIQDIEGDYIHSLAFVSPGRMAWPMPLYELALMTAGRAYDMGIELATTIVPPEDSPLAIFGSTASSAVAELLERAHIQTINSAYAEIPHCGEAVITPCDRRLQVDRVIALPELYGPGVRGIPLGENGFI